MRSVSTALFLLTCCVGCGPPSNVVIVELCGDVEIPTDLDAVRVSILEADRTSANAGTLELFSCPGGDTVELPATHELEAPFGDIWVSVQGLQDGVEVMKSERRLQIQERGAAQDALIPLTQSCMRITCPLGQTCIDGDCFEVPWESDEGQCDGGAPSDGAGGGIDACPGGAEL